MHLHGLIQLLAASEYLRSNGTEGFHPFAKCFLTSSDNRCIIHTLMRWIDESASTASQTTKATCRSLSLPQSVEDFLTRLSVSHGMKGSNLSDGIEEKMIEYD
jgi:hypothetical protein